MEALRTVLEVVGVETGKRDSSVHGHVDSVLLSQLVDHRLGQTGIGEHANLRSDVVPVVLVAQVGQSLLKSGSHLSDSSRHEFEVSVPHLGELLISEDDINDAGSMDRWVGVDGAGDLLDARVDDVTLGSASSNHGEAAGTLTVKTEVLGERLHKHEVVSVVGEQLESVGVFLEVTGSESLVGGVEGAVHVLCLHDLEDGLPLLGSRVDASGVVGADVEENHGVVFGGVEIFAHALEVEVLVLGVEPPVGLLGGEADNVDEASVEGPGLGGQQNVDVLVGVPLLEEGQTESEGSSAGDRLGTGDTLLLVGLVIGTESELLRLVHKRVNALNTGVLVVHIRFEDAVLSDAHTGEDIGFVVVVTVGAHSEENLLWVVVLLEGVVETEDGVCGCGREATPCGEGTGLHELAVSGNERFSEHCYNL